MLWINDLIGWAASCGMSYNVSDWSVRFLCTDQTSLGPDLDCATPTGDLQPAASICVVEHYIDSPHSSLTGVDLFNTFMPFLHLIASVHYGWWEYRLTSGSAALLSAPSDGASLLHSSDWPTPSGEPASSPPPSSRSKFDKRHNWVTTRRHQDHVLF